MKYVDVSKITIRHNGSKINVQIFNKWLKTGKMELQVKNIAILMTTDAHFLVFTFCPNFPKYNFSVLS